MMHEFPVTLPGSAFITVDVMQSELGDDEFIGGCTIDLEDRYFSSNWRR